MITLTVTAYCLRCEWTAGPSPDGGAVDGQAQKHTRAKPGHPTATLAVPAITRNREISAKETTP